MTTSEIAPVTPVETQRADVTEGLAKLLVGLLLAGVAAGALVLLLRRRRSSAAEEAVPVIQRPIVDRPRAEPATMQPTARPATTYAAAPTDPVVRSEPVDTAGGLPNEGAAIALPREAPTDYEERTSLLRRMVAARPDRANPFRSPAARLKRARLIVASLGRKFENGAPRIDLSQYTSNWPSLARRNRTAFA